MTDANTPKRSTVIRTKRAQHFAIMPNSTARDANLSMQAKGLLVLMLSYADGWVYHLRHLEQQHKNGRDATRAALRELIEAGYAQWVVNRSPDGTMAGRELVVSDTPTLDRQPGSQAVGASTDSLENRPPGKPTAGESDTKKNKVKEEQQEEHQLPPRAENVEVVDDPFGEKPLDLTRADRVRMDGKTRVPVSQLSTLHRQVFERLIVFRRLHGKKATDEMFRVWSRELYVHITGYGEPVVLEALNVTILNFPMLNFPWSFYQACLKQLLTSKERSDADEAMTLAPTVVQDLIARAKAGSL